MPKAERKQLGAAAYGGNGDGLVGGRHLLARPAGFGRITGDSGSDGLVEGPLLATTEELQRHASETDADGDIEHARHSAVTELRAALENAESCWGLGTQTKRRLRVEMDCVNRYYI